MVFLSETAWLIPEEIIPKTIGARYWDKLARITTVTLMSIIPIFKFTE